MSLLLCLVLAGGAWEQLADDDDVRVERRPGPRDGLYELRVTGHTPVVPEKLIEVFWSHHEFTQFIPRLKHLVVLKNDGKEKLVYQQVEVPLATDREYTLLVRRHDDPQSHVYESIFVSRNELGPHDPDHVPVPAIRGRWMASPGEHGGSDVLYEIYSDPGEAVPAWLLRRAQVEAAPDLMRAMIHRAETHTPSPAPLVP